MEVKGEHVTRSYETKKGICAHALSERTSLTLKGKKEWR